MTWSPLIHGRFRFRNCLCESYFYTETGGYGVDDACYPRARPGISDGGITSTGQGAQRMVSGAIGPRGPTLMSSPVEIGAWVDVPMTITSTPAFLASLVISLTTSSSSTLLVHGYWRMMRENHCPN